MMAFKRTRHDVRGGALIIVLLLLPILASLSVAFLSSSSMNLVQSSNLAAMTEARLVAESGLSFLLYKLSHCGMSGLLHGQALLDDVAAKLSANLAVSYNGDKTAITIPDIGFTDGKSFGGRITLSDPDTLRLVVTGLYTSGTGASAKTMTRQVAINLHAPTWNEKASKFGVCSNGSVTFGNAVDISGITDANGVAYDSDGSIYSGYLGAGYAVSIGSGDVSGTISVSPPNTVAKSLSVPAGTKTDDQAEPVTMPTIDLKPYKSLLNIPEGMPGHVTTYDPNHPTYTNIRIPAGTNPVFGDVTIKGIMYVERPNNITFSNGGTITGVIVEGDPPTGWPDYYNYINFKNNLTVNGIDSPAGVATLTGDEFSEVRKLSGTTILCPSFTMGAPLDDKAPKNNMTYDGGMLAVKALDVKNNLTATIRGNMLIYGANASLYAKNKATANIRRSSGSAPPGFEGYGLPPVPDPSTYEELTP